MLTDSVVTNHVRNFTVPVPTTIDNVSILAGYEDVRSDFSDSKWAVFKYIDTMIVLSAKGTDFEDFRQQFEDNERCFGYVRLQTGDEMSKRIKFILLTWVGKNVGVMDRAKITSDKALVKEIIKSYAAEFQIENLMDMSETRFRDELFKIGGTHYGTGERNDIGV